MRRAVSPLLATAILIAIVVSAGMIAYWLTTVYFRAFSSSVQVQPVTAELFVSGGRALLTVSVKNVGNKPLVGAIVAGYDDNGKCFKLALPPAEPGQTTGNTLLIPLGAANIVLDGSGSSNHGTVYGATWVDGDHGKALSFDGVDDEVVVSNTGIRYLEQTLTLRVRPDYQISGYYQYHKDIVRKGSEWGVSTTNNFNNDPRLAILFHYFGGEYWWVESSSQLNINSWNFIAVAWNRNEGKIQAFINDARETFNVPTGSLRTDNLPLKVGNGFGGNFKGIADEIRVYSRVPGSAEVAFAYANPGLPPTGGLVLWLPLDEGSNAPFSLTAGNKYSLTITAYSLDGSVATQTLTITASS